MKFGNIEKFDLNSIIPDGWEAVGHRAPQDGEHYLCDRLDGQPYPTIWTGSHATYAHIILKRKRWRAGPCGVYYYINSEAGICYTHEDSTDLDYRRHALGNYFSSEKEAKAAAEKFKALLKEEEV